MTVWESNDSVLTSDTDAARGRVRTGRCLCGAVAFEAAGPLRQVIVCHCADCQRWHGRAAAMTCTDRSGLRVAGEEMLGWYRMPGGPDRGFCTHCGSSLLWSVPGRETVSIPAGTLDDPSELAVRAHVWCDHAATYDVDETADVERHRRNAPHGRDAHIVGPPSPSGPTAV